MKKAILVLIGLIVFIQCGSLWKDVLVLVNIYKLEKKDLKKRNIY